MNQIFKRFFSLILAVVIVFCISGCSNNENVLSFLSYGKTKYAADTDVDGVVCENENWCLIWDDANKRVSFLDKKTNAVWGQTSEEIINKQNETNIILPQLNSALTVAYQDPVSLDEVFVYSYDEAFMNGEITVKKIDNGIRVIYDFSSFEFAIPVEYTIKEDSFDIKITPAHISQGEEFKVSTIKIAPFLCSVQNDADDSWIFIPDGSGAIVEPFTSDTLGVFGESEVYGHDLTTQLYGYGNNKEQVYMPVYGVKKGNNALLAVIDSSPNAASICWEVGSNTFGCSTVYPSFRLRGTNLISRPENFISITTLAEINVFTDGILKEDIRITYYSLSGEDASIVGMANSYRDYLITNKALQKSEEPEKTASFKYVGGVIQPEFILGIPSTKLFALTDTNDAKNMTEELTKEIGNNISVNLVGFGTSGIDVGAVGGEFKTASNLGGNSGMKKLMKSLKDLGVNSYMDFDIISFNKSGNGFTKNSAATYVGGQLVTYTSFDHLSHIRNDDRYYVLSRSNLFKATDKLISKSKKMNLSGISLSSLSNNVYSDYATQDYYVSGKMEKDVTDIFGNIKNSEYKVLASSANVYAAINATEIQDAPLYSSRYSFESYDVPFYQMVFKGYIPMSSISVNLTTDQNDALLRCISAGISPSYTLYNNYDNELVTSQHSFIPSSVFSSNKDRIVNDIANVKEYLSSIENAQITDYKLVADEVALTTFSNGVYVIVNFSDSDVSCEYGNITANSWISGVGE